MESVEVHGTVSNFGDKEAKNVMVSVIFTDTAHDKIVKETVLEGVDLPGAVSVGFRTEYLRGVTTPKTEVDIKIQIDWEEDGQLRTMTR